MSPLSRRFTDADRVRINNAVVAAEARAALEVIPVIARESGRYDRAEDVVGLWFGVLALAVAWSFLPRLPEEPGSWGGMPAWVELGILILAVVFGFIFGAALGVRVDWLRSLFTPAEQKRQEMLARARQVFFDNRVHHTSRSTGLLIYISLLERMATILADQSVLEKLGQKTLDELCERLTSRLHTGGPVDALCDTIQLAGDKAAPVLPRMEGQTNELPDALVLID